MRILPLASHSSTTCPHVDLGSSRHVLHFWPRPTSNVKCRPRCQTLTLVCKSCLVTTTIPGEMLVECLANNRSSQKRGLWSLSLQKQRCTVVSCAAFMLGDLLIILFTAERSFDVDRSSDSCCEFGGLIYALACLSGRTETCQAECWAFGMCPCAQLPVDLNRISFSVV